MVAWPKARPDARERRGARQGFLLESQVRVQVHLRRFDRLVSQPEGDGPAVSTIFSVCPPGRRLTPSCLSGCAWLRRRGRLRVRASRRSWPPDSPSASGKRSSSERRRLRATRPSCSSRRPWLPARRSRRRPPPTAHRDRTTHRENRLTSSRLRRFAASAWQAAPTPHRQTRPFVVSADHSS